MNSDTQQDSLSISGPFPALVRGVDAAGEKFTVNGQLDHLSYVDFYLRLDRQVETFARLLAVTKISRASVVLRGTVLCVEPREQGEYGLTVAITRHRFLP